jgi:hypothetical protein
MGPVSNTTPAASLTPSEAGAPASPLSQIAESILLSSALELRTSESIDKITAGGAEGVSALDLLGVELNSKELELQTNILSSLIRATMDPLEYTASKLS